MVLNSITQGVYLPGVHPRIPEYRWELGDRVAVTRRRRRPRHATYTRNLPDHINMRIPIDV